MPVLARLILPQIAASRFDRVRAFWPKVDRRGPDECWPWTASACKKGYGRFVAGETKVPAHRFAWVITNGVDPDPRLGIMHSCDNPRCCNPAHLTPGTHRDNSLDMMAKGRWQPAPGRVKLTAETAILIANDTRKRRELEQAFGVSRTTIKNVRSGKTWGRATGILRRAEAGK